MEEAKNVKEVNVTLTQIKTEMDRKNPLEVARIRFVTNKGDITYKHKIKKSEFQAGINVETETQPTIAELPQKILDMAKLVQTKQSINLIVAYSFFEEVKDGETVTYRFITSEKTLNDWKIVE